MRVVLLFVFMFVASVAYGQALSADTTINIEIPFDGKGTLVKKISMIGEDTTTISFQKYGKDGKLLQENSYYDDGMHWYSLSTYTYSKSGDIVRGYEFNPIRNDTTYKSYSRYGKRSKPMETYYCSTHYPEYEIKSVYVYGKRMRQLEAVNFDFDDATIKKEEYSYHSDGSYTSQELAYTCEQDIEAYVKPSEGKPYNKSLLDRLTPKLTATSSYDSKGNLIESSYYQGDTLYSKYTNEYDKEGNRVKFKIYYQPNSAIPTEVRDYYQKNQGDTIVESVYRNERLIYHKKYLKSNGALLEICHYSKDGSVDSKSLYSHNERGNLLEVQHLYNDANLSFTTRYTYKYGRKAKPINNIVIFDLPMWVPGDDESGDLFN